MKNIILTVIAIITFSASAIYAETTEKFDEVTLLRQEIQKQEVVLEALKEKLAALEEKNAFEVSITSEGFITHGQHITMNDLGKTLAELPHDAKILFRAEPTISYKEVASVLELCAKAGLKNVVFATTKAEQGGAGQRR